MICFAKFCFYEVTFLIINQENKWGAEELDQECNINFEIPNLYL